MALNVRAGLNAVSSGMCCVAVGDDTLARGAFQVSLGSKLTLPDTDEPTEKKIENYTNTLASVKEIAAIFTAMGQQGHAPKEFVEKANVALYVLIDTLGKRVEALKTLMGSTEITANALVPPKSA